MLNQALRPEARQTWANPWLSGQSIHRCAIKVVVVVVGNQHEVDMRKVIERDARSDMTLGPSETERRRVL